MIYMVSDKPAKRLEYDKDDISLCREMLIA